MANEHFKGLSLAQGPTAEMNAKRERAEAWCDAVAKLTAAKDAEIAQLRGERDTALADIERMKRTHGDRDEWVLAAQRADAARMAAASALASARELLEDAWEERHAMKTSWCNRYREWLTSHPAPVAVPNDERTKAECDYCRKTTLCSTTPGTGGGGLECDPPCAEVLAHTRGLLRKAYVAASSDSEETPRYRATCRACATPLDRTSGAPVAAPCAGCAELEQGYSDYSAKAETRILALEQAINAAVKELERYNGHAPVGMLVRAVLSHLRAAQKAGG